METGPSTLKEVVQDLMHLKKSKTSKPDSQNISLNIVLRLIIMYYFIVLRKIQNVLR